MLCFTAYCDIHKLVCSNIRCCRLYTRICEKTFFILTAYAFIYYRHDVLRDHQFGLARSSIGIFKPLCHFFCTPLQIYGIYRDSTWLYYQNCTTRGDHHSTF